MGSKILIVDDNAEQRFILKKVLMKIGHEVMGEGENGEEAISLVKKLQPDLLVMDIKMPLLDGIEAAKKINSACPIPIILNTAKNDEQTIARAKEAGVMAYLVKPLRVEEIGPTIELAVSRFKEFQALKQENLTLKDAVEVRKIVDKAKGILMDLGNISESKAYRKMQTMSMNMRKPMKEVAKTIIMSSEVK